MSDRDDEELKWLRKNEIKMASSQLLEELIPVFKGYFEGTIALIKDNQKKNYKTAFIFETGGGAAGFSSPPPRRFICPSARLKRAL